MVFPMGSTQTLGDSQHLRGIRMPDDESLRVKGERAPHEFPFKPGNGGDDKSAESNAVDFSSVANVIIVGNWSLQQK